MRRSSSASGVAEKVLLSSSSSTQSPFFRSSSVSSSLDSDLPLPTFNPFSQAAEKERRRLKVAKIFIHFIPVVIVFCAIVLWFFSNQGTEITRLRDALDPHQLFDIKTDF